jgi:hypothetical protein
MPRGISDSGTPVCLLVFRTLVLNVIAFRLQRLQLRLLGFAERLLRGVGAGETSPVEGR